jgi:hypothetical protein
VGGSERQRDDEIGEALQRVESIDELLDASDGGVVATSTRAMLSGALAEQHCGKLPSGVEVANGNVNVRDAIAFATGAPAVA